MASIKKQSVLSIILLCAATAIALVMYANRPPANIAEPEYQPVSVDVASVVMETVRVEVQAQGTVTPLRETAMMAEISGRVVDTSENYLVGGFISEGDVLLRIDPRDYQTNLLRAQAAVEQAESNLAQEKGRAEVALNEWKRLPKGSQRSEDARDLYLRKPQLELAEAQLLAAMADLNTARDNLERTIIKAPYNAVIKAKNSELGQYVGPGTPLADIFAVDYAEVRLPIPQSKLDYLDLPGVAGYGDDALIDLYTDVAGDLKHWPATLHRTEGVFDERSRVLYTVARIADPYALGEGNRQPLRMGSFVNANIAGREIGNLVRLPRHLLRAGNHIWVVDDNRILRNRRVTVLRTGGDVALVSAGLNEGELISLTTLDGSLNGTTVEIRSSTPSDQLFSGESGQALPAEAVPVETPSAGAAITAAVAQ